MLKKPINAQPVFSSKAYASPELVPHPLGTEGEDWIGRRYRFVRAGATTLVVGNALQAPAQLADHQARTPVAAAIGDRLIDISIGATAITADDYAGGVAVIDTTPGLGYTYPIKQHLAASASDTSFVVNLKEGWSIEVALTTTSRVSLYPNPHRGVIQTPVTTLTNTCVGVAVYPIVNAEYGWIGVNGVFGTLINVTPGVGLAVGPPAAVAGAVAINSGTNPIVGYMMDTGVDTLVQGVRWVL